MSRLALLALLAFAVTVSASFIDEDLDMNEDDENLDLVNVEAWKGCACVGGANLARANGTLHTARVARNISRDENRRVSAKRASRILSGLVDLRASLRQARKDCKTDNAARFENYKKAVAAAKRDVRRAKAALGAVSEIDEDDEMLAFAPCKCSSKHVAATVNAAIHTANTTVAVASDPERRVSFKRASRLVQRIKDVRSALRGSQDKCNASNAKRLAIYRNRRETFSKSVDAANKARAAAGSVSEAEESEDDEEEDDEDEDEDEDEDDEEDAEESNDDEEEDDEESEDDEDEEDDE